MPAKNLDALCINTIRTLSMDAVQQANSGHPGTPMAMAPAVYCLWQRFLRFDPHDPIWPNRDRFVLSVGHASMLLYSMLYLCGVQAVNPQYEQLGTPSVTLDDIKHFRQLPEGWDKDLPTFEADPKGLASRDASARVLNVVAEQMPWLIGAAAHLALSTKTRLTFEGAGDLSSENYGGRNLHFGIREHAMGAILNGLSLCKVRPYGSGFLIFTDYARPALRLSALMEIPVIYIMTHDSIGLGEDGPTHQPIEQLASLRAVPGLITIRPADANEVTEAWRVIMQLRHDPVVLVLSRQALPTLDRSTYAPASGVAKGAYILADAVHGRPQVRLLASGSEVSLCLAAYEQLMAEGINARVISMPSWELFEHQSQDYRDQVIPPEVTARVSVEEASTFGWASYLGATGQSIGMRTFGASAPLKALQQRFGFTPEHVVTAAKEQLQNAR